MMRCAFAFLLSRRDCRCPKVAVGTEKVYTYSTCAPVHVSRVFLFEQSTRNITSRRLSFRCYILYCILKNSPLLVNSSDGTPPDTRKLLLLILSD